MSLKGFGKWFKRNEQVLTLGMFVLGACLTLWATIALRNSKIYDNAVFLLYSFIIFHLIYDVYVINKEVKEAKEKK